MSRTRVRLAATGAAVVLAVTGLSGAAAADTTVTTTPPTGQAVITSDLTFLQSAVTNGIVIVPLPPATPAYADTTGLTTTLPVSGGVANIPAFNGDIQFGGDLLFVNIATGKTVIFKQLDLVINKGKFFAVPDGATAPVALLDPAGRVSVGRNGTAQTLDTTGLKVDAAAAQYLDTNLGTTFFTAGQSIGSLAVTYTPGS
ncbi:hypothetical protein ACFV4F_18750 [Kitasatospora sp. NPDC059722]|uniref:hypothetical protein n=1 Tax=Kitasatospora sp. NPDC059722 TaxID=3346925 RepID=UPI00367B77C2